MDKTYLISQSTSLTLVIIISLAFTLLGLYHAQKFKGLNNYLTANRNVGLFSLTTSMVASALGAWILFGPASAATWGGVGAVIGYALGTAFPMIFLIYLGQKIRKDFPNGSTLVEFLRKKFGQSLFKLILLMIIFYMFVFLCAEVTAVAVLINYISGTINRRLASVVTVSDAEVAEAVRYAFKVLKLVVEPGGAVSLAAVLAGKVETAGLTTAVVLSGGNVDPTLFSAIIEDRFQPGA